MPPATDIHPALIDAGIPERCEFHHVTKDKNPDEWHALRAGGVGSSDAGVILGLSPYMGPVELWGTKLGLLPPKDLSKIPSVFFGTAMEEPIAQWFAMQTGFEVIDPKATLVLRDDPTLRTNPDRFYIDDDGEVCLLEIKTCDAHLSKDWEEGRSPAWYQAQLAQQMIVTGVQRGKLICIIGGNQPVIVDVDLTSDYLDFLRTTLTSWWQTHVVGRQRPAVDDKESTSDALNALNPSDGSTIDLGLAGLDIACRYKHAHEQVKHWEAEKRLYGNEMRAMLGTAAIGECDGVKIASNKAGETRRLDLEAHAEHAPECHAKFRTTTPTRTLLVSDAKPAVALREAFLEGAA